MYTAQWKVLFSCKFRNISNVMGLNGPSITQPYSRFPHDYQFILYTIYIGFNIRCPLYKKFLGWHVTSGILSNHSRNLGAQLSSLKDSQYNNDTSFRIAAFFVSPWRWRKKAAVPKWRSFSTELRLFYINWSFINLHSSLTKILVYNINQGRLLAYWCCCLKLWKHRLPNVFCNIGLLYSIALAPSSNQRRCLKAGLLPHGT